MARSRPWLVVVLLLVGGACDDVAIGTFAPGTTGVLPGDSSGAGGDSSSSSGTGAAEGEGDESTTAGAAACVDEDFAGALDRSRWDPWNDSDGSVASSGALTIVPTTGSEQAVGIKLVDTEATDFQSGRVRMQVLTEPALDSESELFLQMVQRMPATSALVSVAVYKGTMRATAAHDDGSIGMFETVAADAPPWIGIRTADGQVYFEGSSDGVTWDVIASTELPAALSGVVPLVMVWNNPTGAAIDAQPVVVDNLSLCID